MPEEFKPMKGIRVVEMSHMIMGPSTSMFLASLGAEVVKVEPPQGDKTRYLTGMGRPMFPLFNLGKKSVVLDTDTEEGLRKLDTLLSTADVFLENFRDSTLKHKGLDAETLRTKYPELIVASCKGFLSGPYESRAVLDEVVQMMTGLAYMTGPTGQPLRVGSSANDIMGGLFGAFSVLAALMERQKTNEGRAIRVGLFENCLLLVAQHMVEYELEGKNPPPMPEREFSWPVYDIFKDRDGQQIFIGAVTEGQWKAFCTLLDLKHFLEDHRLCTQMDKISARTWTIPVIANRVSEWALVDLCPQLEDAGLPFSPISRPCDMYNDPHAMRPGGMTVSQYDNKTFRVPNLPVEIDGTSVFAGGKVPDIGEHTEDLFGPPKRPT